jgi:uncharacterized protein (DUF1499 family)
MKGIIRAMGIAAALGIIAFLGLLAFVRLVPSDPAQWQVDVATVEKPASPNNWLLRDGADGPAIALALPPDAALARIRAVALATPRTEVLAEDATRITFITRSRVMGWPDYTTVEVTPSATGSSVAVFARARFGYSDMGVNRARVQALAAALSP